MADDAEHSAFVCDNGSGMVKVRNFPGWKNFLMHILTHCATHNLFERLPVDRLGLLAMMRQELYFRPLLVVLGTKGLWLAWAKKCAPNGPERTLLLAAQNTWKRDLSFLCYRMPT
jgi:hypothetical protein